MPQKFNIVDGVQTGTKGVTGVAINQTVGMLVFPNFNEFYCLAYMTYDFNNFNWTDDNGCFFKLAKYLDWYSMATMESTF